MSASDQVRDSHGTLISDAHRIAWYFLNASGQIHDEYAELVLLSQIVINLAARGIAHKIRLANMAIAEFGRQAPYARRRRTLADRMATGGA